MSFWCSLKQSCVIGGAYGLKGWGVVGDKVLQRAVEENDGYWEDKALLGARNVIALLQATCVEDCKPQLSEQRAGTNEMLI